jgi:hypothetical protein
MRQSAGGFQRDRAVVAVDDLAHVGLRDADGGGEIHLTGVRDLHREPHAIRLVDPSLPKESDLVSGKHEGEYSELEYSRQA